MSNVDWCARRAKAQSRLSLKDGVILGRGLSVNEFSSSVVGAGEVMLTGTICFVQMGVVVSAIGVGKVSGIAKNQPLNLTNESKILLEFEKPRRV